MKKIYVTRPDLPPLDEYAKYLNKIWDSRKLTNNGQFVKSLEKKLEEYLKVNNLALVANGTLGLHLSIKALNLEGEVITSPFTFAATTNAIIWENLTPVFADIDPETFNISPEDLEKKITNKTSAIMAVHVYGNPCSMERLQRISEKHNLRLIYDAAHAFGVKYENKPIASYGDISVLSFHATKVFSTIEGGAIIAKDKKLSDKTKLLRDHGIKSEKEIALPGTNAKMNELQAAMGLCSLKSIDEKIKCREKIYNHYKAELTDSSINFQKITASRYNYSYMPVCFNDIKERDRIYSELLKNKIHARKYFYPLTTDFNYLKSQNLTEKYHLKHSADIAGRVLCLPIYPDLEMKDVDRIIIIIKRAQRKSCLSRMT